MRIKETAAGDVEIETDGGGDQALAALVNWLWSWPTLVVVVVSIVALLVAMVVR